MDYLKPGRSPAETAVILNVKESTLAAWRSLGRGPRFRKNGRHIEYPDEAIREHQEAHTFTPELAEVRRQRKAMATEAKQQTAA